MRRWLTARLSLVFSATPLPACPVVMCASVTVSKRAIELAKYVHFKRIYVREE